MQSHDKIDATSSTHTEEAYLWTRFLQFGKKKAKLTRRLGSSFLRFSKAIYGSHIDPSE